MYQEKTVIVDNIPVSYCVNDGDESEQYVLLLHGWGSSKESYSGIQYQIPGAIAIDLPGFGKTPLGGEEWTVLQYAQFVSRFAEAIGVHDDVVDIIGLALGGRIAVELIDQKLIETSSITLVGTPIYREQQNSDSLRVRLGRIIRALPGGTALREWYFRKYVGVDDYLDLDREEMVGTFKRVLDYHVHERLPLYGVDVNLLWGAEDDSIASHPAMQAAEKYGYDVEVITGAGHIAFADAPEQFINRYREMS